MKSSVTRRDFLAGLSVAATAAFPKLDAKSAWLRADQTNKAVHNPYAGVDWSVVERHKAGLHMHTVQSDGRQTVNQVVQAYRNAKYSILSITDHDWNKPQPASPYPTEPRPQNYPANPTWPWTDYGTESPQTLGMLGIQGNELTYRHHINSYFSDYGVWYERTGPRAPYGGIVDAGGKIVWEDDQLRAISDKGGLAILNHPGIPDDRSWWERKPLDWYVERYQKHSPACLIGIEVTNCDRIYEGYDEGLWDQLLARFMPERPIWGFGTDDMHDLHNARHSHSVFFLQQLDDASVRRAMETGQFCFFKANTATGTERVDYLQPSPQLEACPMLQRVAVDEDAGTITIQASDCDEIRWISAPASLEPVDDYRTSDAPWPAGQVVHVGPTLDYRQTADVKKYVRAELHRSSNGRLLRTFTNPFGIRART